jgi:ribonuclease VapC
MDASRDPIATRRFDDVVKEANVSSEPVTETQMQTARVA